MPPVYIIKRLILGAWWLTARQPSFLMVMLPVMNVASKKDPFNNNPSPPFLLPYQFILQLTSHPTSIHISPLFIKYLPYYSLFLHFYLSILSLHSLFVLPLPSVPYLFLPILLLSSINISQFLTVACNCQLLLSIVVLVAVWCMPSRQRSQHYKTPYGFFYCLPPLIYVRNCKLILHICWGTSKNPYRS